MNSICSNPVRILNDLLYSIYSIAEIEASEVDILTRPACSNPVNMPDSSEMPIQGLPFITGEGSSSKITFEFLYQFTFSTNNPFCLNRQLRAIASFADHMRPGAVQHSALWFGKFNNGYGAKSGSGITIKGEPC